MVSAVDPSLTNGRQIFANLERPEIKAVVNKWIDEIVLGLATLIHIFNPSCVVLGGGIMVQPYILEQIHARIPQMVMSSFAHVQISSAELGNSAGLLGAYILLTETLKLVDYSSWFLHCGEFKYILSVKLINIKNILTGMKLKCLLSVRILTFYLHSFIFPYLHLPRDDGLYIPALHEQPRFSDF